MGGAFVVACGERGGDGAGLFHTVHEWCAGDAVVAHADEDGFAVGGGGEYFLDCGMAHQGAHVAVEGAGCAATLNMSQDGDAGVFAQAFFEDLLDVGAADRFAMAIAGSFGDDDDAVATPCFAPSAEDTAHGLFPVIDGWGAFGDEYPIGSGGDGAHEGKIAAVTAHDFDNEGALMAGGGAADGVDGFGDAVEGGVGSYGHVGSSHVIVDRADKSDDGELGMVGGNRWADEAVGDGFGEEVGPFLAKEVRAGEASVAANDDQAVNFMREEVDDGAETTCTGLKVGASGGADQGATTMEDAANRVPGHGADAVATIDHALVAFGDCVDGDT